VDDEIERAPFALEGAEQGFERLVVLNVGFEYDFGAERLHQRLHALAETFALIGESHFGAVGV